MILKKQIKENIGLIYKEKIMGREFTLHIELKINGRWEHYKEANAGYYPPIVQKLGNMINLDSEYERNNLEDWNYDKESLEDRTLKSWFDIKPISDNRGLPEDVNIVTKIDVAEDRGCEEWGYGYIQGKDEIMEFINFCEENIDSENASSCSRWVHGTISPIYFYDIEDLFKTKEDLKEEEFEAWYPLSEIEDIRFVFWCSI